MMTSLTDDMTINLYSHLLLTIFSYFKVILTCHLASFLLRIATLGVGRLRFSF